MNDKPDKSTCPLDPACSSWGVVLGEGHCLLGGLAYPHPRCSCLGCSTFDPATPERSCNNACCRVMGSAGAGDMYQGKAECEECSRLRRRIIVLADDDDALESNVAQLRENVAELRQQLTDQRENNHRRNLELDALHYVWCDGGCEDGTHRWQPARAEGATKEIVEAAVRNTQRLVNWWNNQKALEGTTNYVFPDGSGGDGVFLRLARGYVEARREAHHWWVELQGLQKTIGRLDLTIAKLPTFDPDGPGSSVDRWVAAIDWAHTEILVLRSNLEGARLRVDPLQRDHEADTATINRLRDERNAEMALADQLAAALKRTDEEWGGRMVGGEGACGWCGEKGGHRSCCLVDVSLKAYRERRRPDAWPMDAPPPGTCASCGVTQPCICDHARPASDQAPGGGT